VRRKGFASLKRKEIEGKSRSNDLATVPGNHEGSLWRTKRRGGGNDRSVHRAPFGDRSVQKTLVRVGAQIGKPGEKRLKGTPSYGGPHHRRSARPSKSREMLGYLLLGGVGGPLARADNSLNAAARLIGRPGESGPRLETCSKMGEKKINGLERGLSGRLIVLGLQGPRPRATASGKKRQEVEGS